MFDAKLVGGVASDGVREGGTWGSVKFQDYELMGYIYVLHKNNVEISGISSKSE